MTHSLKFDFNWHLSCPHTDTPLNERNKEEHDERKMNIK